MQVSHAAVQQGQVRSRPGGLLLEALVALPDLAGTLGLSSGLLYCLLSARHHILHKLRSLQWYCTCSVTMFMLGSKTGLDCNVKAAACRAAETGRTGTKAQFAGCFQPVMLFNSGQEDKLQIDGINRLIKAMQEITSPTPTLSPSRPQVAKTTRSQPVAKAGNSRAAATSRNSSNVARTGNMQTASMRSSTPVSTSSRSVSASGSPSSSQNQATSSSSLDRSQAVHGGNAVETIQQAVQMLQWFVQEASQLPTAARLEALRYGCTAGIPCSQQAYDWTNGCSVHQQHHCLLALIRTV